jgi:hypothetical protein
VPVLLRILCNSPWGNFPWFREFPYLVREIPYLAGLNRARQKGESLNRLP